MSSFLGGGGGGSSGLVVGTTTITGGTNKNLLFDNNGVLGENAPPTFLVKATSNTTYFVSTTGSDSNNGLTSGTAFATFDHAMLVIAGFDWLNFLPSIQVENGTYTQNLILGVIPSSLGLINGQVSGSPSTPSNVVLANPGGTISLSAIDTDWTVDGFQLNLANNRTAVQCLSSGISNLSVDDIIFNNISGISDICLKIVTYNFMFVGVSNFLMTVTGTWDSFLFCQSWSNIQGNGVTVTLSPGVTFSNFGGQTIVVDEYAEIDGGNGGFTFSGTATGQRFSITRHSTLTLQALGGGAITRAQVPGNSVGIIDRTSEYTSDTVYTVATPTSGSTVTAIAGQHSVVLNPAGALATLTVNLPSNMSDSETYKISSSKMITALTINSTDGSTVIAPPTTLAAGSGTTMIFDTAANTWYPYA